MHRDAACLQGYRSRVSSAHTSWRANNAACTHNALAPAPSRRHAMPAREYDTPLRLNENSLKSQYLSIFPLEMHLLKYADLCSKVPTADMLQISVNYYSLKLDSKV